MGHDGKRTATGCPRRHKGDKIHALAAMRRHAPPPPETFIEGSLGLAFLDSGRGVTSLHGQIHPAKHFRMLPGRGLSERVRGQRRGTTENTRRGAAPSSAEQDNRKHRAHAHAAPRHRKARTARRSSSLALQWRCRPPPPRLAFYLGALAALRGTARQSHPAASRAIKPRDKQRPTNAGTRRTALKHREARSLWSGVGSR